MTTAAKPPSTSTPAGSRPTIFPATSSRKCNSASTTASGTAHSRKRGVECTVEGRTPIERKITMNNHYNGTFLEPWGERSQRGYGIEVLGAVRSRAGHGRVRRPDGEAGRAARSRAGSHLQRPFGRAANRGRRRRRWKPSSPGTPLASRIASSNVDHPAGGLVLLRPGTSEIEVLYKGSVSNPSPSGRGQGVGKRSLR